MIYPTDIHGYVEYLNRQLDARFGDVGLYVEASSTGWIVSVEGSVEPAVDATWRDTLEELTEN